MVEQALVIGQFGLLAASAKIIHQSTKCLSINLNRFRFGAFLSRIFSNQAVNRVPVLHRQIGISRTPAGDRSGLACLGQVLLKLSGLVRLRRFGNRVLHLQRSCYIK
ncbi:hypothetical protein A6X20_41600 [Bradyrhizobium elkanii]|nr:hypothetical protein A6X20_41600 [Bradyrhizobium elkanii]ODM82196.1 hypothetical protein A6452_21220 [Bradyrhizobium elkanii]